MDTCYTCDKKETATKSADSCHNAKVEMKKMLPWIHHATCRGVPMQFIDDMNQLIFVVVFFFLLFNFTGDVHSTESSKTPHVCTCSTEGPSSNKWGMFLFFFQYSVTLNQSVFASHCFNCNCFQWSVLVQQFLSVHIACLHACWLISHCPSAQLSMLACFQMSGCG